MNSSFVLPRRLEDLPNVGPATAADLRLLGIHDPEQLKGRDGLDLYQALCRKTGQRQDPCVADVFLAVTQFVRDGVKRPWWDFAAERKRRMPANGKNGDIGGDPRNQRGVTP